MDHSLLPSIKSASLPVKYQAAKVALAECNRIDECKDWGCDIPPWKPGVYSFWDLETCLYVGASRNMRKRMQGHERKREWRLCSILWITVDNPFPLELWFINQLKPSGNGFTGERREREARAAIKHSKTSLDEKLDEACEAIFGSDFLTIFTKPRGGRAA
jgi:hypothetical protein